jgi:FkbM family methyltransferase
VREVIIKSLSRVIRWLPRAKLLNFIAQQYTFHYYNLYNSAFERNGELRWLRECLPPLAQPVIFDVGANIGDWSAAVLALNNNCLIHAFEPMHTTFAALRQRFEGNSRVQIVNEGLSSAPGEAELKVFDQASGHNSIRGRIDRTANHTVKIKLTTLDDYCAAHHIERIDLLKIDTEGHETAVLQGAKRLLSQGSIDRIQIEYTANYILERAYLKDVFDLLQPHGYQMFRIMPEHLEHVPAYHEHFENFMYCNYAAVRS